MSRLLTLTLLAFLMSVSSAFAETTDWMPRREYESYTLKLKARKMLPTRIQCRPGKNGVPYEVKLTSVPNKKNIGWQVRVYRTSASPRVMGVVPSKSYDHFQSRSGAWYHCTIR